MWLDNDWKLVQNVTYKPDGTNAQEPYELYNVIGDPGEEQNLIDLYPERAARMRKQLDAWSLSVSRSGLGWDYPEGRVLPTGRAPNPELDERRRTRMKEWEEEVNKASKTPTKRTDAEMSDSSNPGNLVHYPDFPTELIPPRPVTCGCPRATTAHPPIDTRSSTCTMASSCSTGASRPTWAPTGCGRGQDRDAARSGRGDQAGDRRFGLG